MLVLGSVVYPIIYKVLYIPGGWEWDFWTINSVTGFFFLTKTSGRTLPNTNYAATL